VIKNVVIKNEIKRQYFENLILYLNVGHLKKMRSCQRNVVT